MTIPPLVSVIIRSHRRVPQMLELLAACTQQRYPRFEIVVIEQSPEQRAEHAEALEQARRDPRVRLFEHDRLGPARARNEGVRQARGDVLLFIDDDDLPLDEHWITAHARNYTDPDCAAVTGREVRSEDEDPTPHNTDRNRRLCLRYSWLKMPRARTRHTMRIKGVTALQGGNTSIRRTVIDRVGGWDEDVEGHEENSFDFRFARIKPPSWYYLFDPAPTILRRLDIEGGLSRRHADVADILQHEVDYSHRILRRYHPLRFYLLYPAYLTLAVQRTMTHIRQHDPNRPAPTLLAEAARRLPAAVAGSVARG